MRFLSLFFVLALALTIGVVIAESSFAIIALVSAESYTVVVSVDHGATWRPVPLPSRIVRYILDEMGMRHTANHQPSKVAEIRIKMTEKGKQDQRYIMQCH